jgi:type IV secretory pathway VirJ component
MTGIALMLLALARPAEVGPDTTLLPDLPLVEVRADHPGRTLAVLLSGDGDWAAFVRNLAVQLTSAGIPVVGLKSRSYLTGRPAKDPDIAGRDLARVLGAYLPASGADSVLLIGYSRGADLAPFMVSRLPSELRGRVAFLALLSPTTSASFVFHTVDLISDRRRPEDLDVLPEVRKLAGLRILCIYGTRDTHSLCPTTDTSEVKVIARDQGHRMSNAGEIGALILGAWHSR